MRLPRFACNRFLHLLKWSLSIIILQPIRNAHVELVEVHPQMCWVDTAANLGFGGAAHAGVSEASGDHFLILNPDSQVLDANWYEFEKELAGGEILCADLFSPMDARSFRVGFSRALPLNYYELMLSGVLIGAVIGRHVSCDAKV